MLVALVLAVTSCGKGKPSNTPGASSLSNKLAAITQAGQPVTAQELDEWYAAPPDADNAAALYAQAFAALTPDDPRTPAFLARNQKALQFLLQAAERKSCRYPVDLSAGLSTTLPHLAHIKKCASLLEAEAAAQAGRGRTDQAGKAVLASLRLARSLENEPVLISQLVRFAAERSALSGLEQALARKPFEADQLLSLQAALRDAGRLAPFARALAGERCSIIAAFQALSEEQAKVLSGTTARYADYQKTPTWQEDFNLALDCYASLLAAAGKPLPEAFASVADTEARMEDARAKGLLISAGILPGIRGVFPKLGDATARLRAAQAALAVERYRLKHDNGLPASLDGLVPEFLDAVPADPFDGQPLRYEKLAGGGYVVYSVGKDRQDDRGASAPAGGKEAAPSDITFEVRR